MILKTLKFNLSIFLFILKLSMGFCQLPLPEVIENIKPYIVAIEALDDTIIVTNVGDSIKYKSQGSGIFIGFHEKNVYALTNEHVIAIKDSTNKTLRYAKKIVVFLNVKGLGARGFPAEIRMVDEKLDLAALRVFYPHSLRDSLEAKAMSVSLFEDESNLREGEMVLYSGYPLNLGKGQRNYPLTRLGMISQLISDNNNFLIDAFVQPGYSGSPVFLIKSEGNYFPQRWKYSFIGLTSGHPYRMAPIYKKVQYIQIPNVVYPENPGFAVVVGIKAIKKFLNVK